MRPVTVIFHSYGLILQSVPFKAKLNYMKRLFFRLTALLCGLFSFYLVNAQSRNPMNVMTTAVPFLRISPDARAGGYG